MSEWFAEWEFNHGDQIGTDGTYAGKLTQGDVDDLLNVIEMSNSEWNRTYGSAQN